MEILKKPELIHVGGSRAQLRTVRIGNVVRFIVSEGTIERAAIDIALDQIPNVIMGICQCAGIAVHGKKELDQ